MSIKEIYHKLLSSLKGKETSKLISNFFSLFVLQFLNVILPLVTIPYLIATVGLELYGLLSFAYAFSYFFQIIVDYGFNTSATRDISVAVENKRRVNLIFNEVFSTKILLIVAVGCIYTAIVFSFDRLSQHSTIYMWQFACVVGQGIFPVWFFQGVQQMRYITYINVFFKTIFTLAIFVFVKNPEAVWLVPFFNALGFIFAGIVSLFILYKYFEVRWQKISGLRIRRQLQRGMYLFLSEVQIAVIANGNTLILGFFAGDYAVGVYAAAEKIIRAIGSLQSPLINAVFPHISRSMKESYEKTMLNLKLFKKYIVLFFVFVTIILFAFAPLFFELIFRASMSESVLVFRIIVLFPLLSFLDQFYGKLILLTNGREQDFFKVFMWVSVISLFLSCILSFFYQQNGTAMASLISQCLIFLGMHYYVRQFAKSR